ncbi:MAG: hypothetical protein DDT27_01476 [Dehalococcoidia bacterium]|nr:hypothetical protein [Chloroflexota bacterium]MBT9162911.1 hypothetical protein [Chloroflexota bacterium]
MAGIRGERHVYGDKVGSRQQFLQAGDVFKAKGCLFFRLSLHHIVIEYLHIKPPGAFGHFHPDTSGTDNS